MSEGGDAAGRLDRRQALGRSLQDDMRRAPDEDDSEDSDEEWNYIRVKPCPSEKGPTPQHTEESSEEMESQLNPNAAVFVPLSPTSEDGNNKEQPFNENLTQEEFFNKTDVMSSSFIAPTLNLPSKELLNGQSSEDICLAGSPKKSDICMDNIITPSEDEFRREVSTRPSECDEAAEDQQSELSLARDHLTKFNQEDLPREVKQAEENQPKGFNEAEEDMIKGFDQAEEHQPKGVDQAEELQPKCFDQAEEHQPKGFDQTEEHQPKGFDQVEEDHTEKEKSRDFDQAQEDHPSDCNQAEENQLSELNQVKDDQPKEMNHVQEDRLTVLHEAEEHPLLQQPLIENCENSSQAIFEEEFDDVPPKTDNLEKVDILNVCADERSKFVESTSPFLEHDLNSGMLMSPSADCLRDLSAETPALTSNPEVLIVTSSELAVNEALSAEPIAESTPVENILFDFDVPTAADATFDVLSFDEGKTIYSHSDILSPATENTTTLDVSNAQGFEALGKEVLPVSPEVDGINVLVINSSNNLEVSGITSAEEHVNFSKDSTSSGRDWYFEESVKSNDLTVISAADYHAARSENPADMELSSEAGKTSIVPQVLASSETLKHENAVEQCELMPQKSEGAITDSSVIESFSLEAVPVKCAASPLQSEPELEAASILEPSESITYAIPEVDLVSAAATESFKMEEAAQPKHAELPSLGEVPALLTECLQPTYSAEMEMLDKETFSVSSKTEEADKEAFSVSSKAEEADKEAFSVSSKTEEADKEAFSVSSKTEEAVTDLAVAVGAGAAAAAATAIVASACAAKPATSKVDPKKAPSKAPMKAKPGLVSKANATTSKSAPAPKAASAAGSVVGPKKPAAPSSSRLLPAKPKPAEPTSSKPTATSTKASAPAVPKPPAKPKSSTTTTTKPMVTEKKPLTNGVASKPSVPRVPSSTRPASATSRTVPSKTTASGSSSSTATKTVPPTSHSTGAVKKTASSSVTGTTRPKPLVELKPKPIAQSSSVASRPRPAPVAAATAKSSGPKVSDKQVKENTNKIISSRSTAAKPSTVNKSTVSKSSTAPTTATAPGSKPTAIRKPAPGTAKSIVKKANPSDKPTVPESCDEHDPKSDKAIVPNGVSHDPVDKKEPAPKIEEMIDNQLVG